MNQHGFTLIEMLIVLFIISVLILITIPNVTKHMNTVDEKGCDAYIYMVQGQVESYRMEKKKIPTMQELEDEGYLKKGMNKCPNGDEIIIELDGTVITKASRGEND